MIRTPELPELDVKPWVGSRRGQEYVTANSVGICNEGEQAVEALTDGYKPVRIKYQVAEVTKALCSAGQMCDQGNVLVFTSTGGYIHHQATQKKTPFAREGNMYVLNTWVRQPSEEGRSPAGRPASPFCGPGAARLRPGRRSGANGIRRNSPLSSNGRGLP